MKGSSFYPISLIIIIILFSCNLAINEDQAETPVSGGLFFDDFSYTGADDTDLTAFNWTIRSGLGGPGPADCTWSQNNIDFITDPDNSENVLMRLTATTSGTGATTSQAEIYHQQKFREGTFASRIRFTDAPHSGSPDGDQINETFFIISPLVYAMDPDYSEVDFVEYLANGGWGKSGSSFWMTSWETYNPDPWTMVSQSDSSDQSYAGWHIVACTIKDGMIKFYIDGNLMATHSGDTYPESLMSLNYNLWFIADGLLSDVTARSYVEEVDWVFHNKNIVMNLNEINSRVNQYRSGGITREDTIQ